MPRTTIYHWIVSEKKWDEVNLRNKKLLREFLSYCASTDRSPATIQQYESQLKIFFIWNMEENYNKFFIDIKKREFVRFFGYGRQELGWSSARTASLRAALSSFSNYIERYLDDEYPLFRNMVKVLEPIQVEPVREKTVVTASEIEDLLEALIAKGDIQEACWVSLLYSSGMRKAEAVQMKDSFFTDSNKIDDILYKTPKIRTKGRGKQGKQAARYVFCYTFDPYLQKWREERKRLGIGLDELFVVKREGGYIPATVTTFNSWSQRLTVFLGKNFYPHMMRHLWTTQLKQKGYPDNIIQKLQQWASTDMIQIYNDSADEDEIMLFLRSKEGKGENQNDN